MTFPRVRDERQPVMPIPQPQPRRLPGRLQLQHRECIYKDICLVFGVFGLIGIQQLRFGPLK